VPHGVTTQKTPFFIVTAVRTSNVTAHFQLEQYIISHLLCFSQFPSILPSSYLKTNVMAGLEATVDSLAPAVKRTSAVAVRVELSDDLIIVRIQVFWKN
jgi:hypothetical protein